MLSQAFTRKEPCFAMLQVTSSEQWWKGKWECLKKKNPTSFFPLRCCAARVHQSASSRWPCHCRPGHVQLHWSTAHFICLFKSVSQLQWSAVLKTLYIRDPRLKSVDAIGSGECQKKIKWIGEVMSEIWIAKVKKKHSKFSEAERIRPKFEFVSM